MPTNSQPSPTKEFGIAFGLLSPTIGEQIKKQGLNCTAKKAKHFEELRQCIIKLYFGELISDSDESKLRMKLFSKIKSHLRKSNPGIQFGK